MHPSHRLVVVFASLAFGAGCRTTPPPRPVPKAGFEMSWAATDPALPRDPVSSLRAFRVEVFGLDAEPQDGFSPLVDRVRVESLAADERVFEAWPRLLAGARVATASRDALQLGSSQSAGTTIVLLPGGAVAELQVFDLLSPASVRDSEFKRAITVRLEPAPQPSEAQGSNRAEPPVTAVLTLSSLIDADSEEPTTGDAERAQTTIAIEKAILGALPGDRGGAMAIVIPTLFPSWPSRTLALVVEPIPGWTPPAAPQPGEEEALRDVRAWLASSAAASAERIPGADEALRAIAAFPSQRTALFQLARESGAAITEDLALIAEGALLARVALSLLARVAQAPKLLDRAALASAMEGVTLETLAELQTGNRLDPPLAALLDRQLGQAARQAGSVEELSKFAKGIDALRSRIVEENRSALEDASPAARVRSYDWLARRGLAPPEFDPLGPLAQRRAALEKALAALETNAPSPGAGERKNEVQQ